MPAILPRSGRRVALVLASSALVLSTVAGVHAQEDGFSGVFGHLFGGTPRQTVAPAPAPVQAAPSYYGGGEVNERYRWRRHARGAERRAKPKVRYAALPNAEDVSGVSGKQPVDQKAIAANPTAALLRDETLRPGDIVVMPNGPKVFLGHEERGRGAKANRHRMSDFEDVRNSRSVDSKTRKQLLAMMVPQGAMPAEEARKALAKARRLAPKEEIETLTRQARNETGEGTRVISLWKAAQ
ncbi:hypothetical protein HNR00_001647 [Methylorubrum rhodinum]|uniref:Uncharacterized protein n=1 Tax=Methylorubrum rhodinum TaxID=29428 RepID=A0A840ZGL4_9HYPH|nr:hypothetical protein [Methylorubrum rhodinum]MBB5756939.1 hypothetical protein [Methylorubrum rhodinum]